MDITKWHAKNKEIVVHVFWDNKGAKNETRVDPNLTFHKLGGEKFVEMLCRCRAVATTSGFELVCEALYLGKPVLLRPNANHYEQECNAIDAMNSGAGIISTDFDVSKLLEFCETYVKGEGFCEWAQQAEQVFLHHLGIYGKG